MDTRHPTPFQRSLALLCTRRFGTFWFASLLSNIGTWAQQLAQPWLLLKLGASPWLIGLDSFANGAPAFLLTFLGGTLADRADRRRVITLFQSVQALCPTAIMVLLLGGWARAWMVITASLVIGITDALSMPSFQTIVASLVEREQLPLGLSLNSTQFNLSRILGPALAGVLMAQVGPTGAYAVNAASYLPFICVALWILPRGVAATASPWREDSAQALRQVANDHGLRGALLTVLAGSVLCAPVVTFCPVLVRDAFGAGIGTFSLTAAAFGLGGVIGATGLLGVDPRRDRRPLATGFARVFGLVLMLIATDRWLWALPWLYLAAGACMTAGNVSTNAFIQIHAPAELRGRAISLYMIAMRGGLAVGALATGGAVHLLGVRGALLFDGAAAISLQWGIGYAWARQAVRSNI